MLLLRRYLPALWALLCAAAPAVGWGGSVIASFNVPGLSSNGPRGLAADGDGLYAVADNRGPNRVRIFVFNYDGENAGIEREFNCPAAVFWAMDLAWRPTPARLYVASDLTASGQPARIYVLNDETGAVTNQFDSPFGPDVHVNGLTWDGSYLYASSYDVDLVYRMNYKGSVLGSFRADHAVNHGLAVHGSALWLVSGRPHFDARAYSPTGGFLTDFTFDVNDEYVGGACWGRDSFLSLFVSTYTGEQYIYEINTDPRAYGGIAVEPTSMGRVKALFR
jgi:hypothetical protein